MEQIGFAARVAVALAVCVAMQAQLGDLGINSPASGPNQAPAAENATLFLNVRVFDGRNTTLSPPSSVLVKGNTIERLSTPPTGHGDFRFPFEVPRTLGGPLSQSEADGVAAIADSPDEVRLRAREQLRHGASQIKLMAGGGVASPYNPIESTQFTEPEIRAALEAAENWGTYVTVHAYIPRAIRQAVAAGVKCIEHGHLIDEPTAWLLADKGIWWSLQPFLNDQDAPVLVNPVSQHKMLQVFAGTDNAYQLARKL